MWHYGNTEWVFCTLSALQAGGVLGSELNLCWKGLCVALAQPLVVTLGVALVGAGPAPSVCEGTQKELWNCLTLERLVLWLSFS